MILMKSKPLFFELLPNFFIFCRRVFVEERVQFFEVLEFLLQRQGHEVFDVLDIEFGFCVRLFRHLLIF